jgi:CorA-like Mg2+ transporter protein
VLWAILDQVIKGYGPVVADLESDIEQVEGTVFSGAVAPTERIYDLRREVSDFYRAVHPLLAVLTRVERNVDEPDLQPYLRDVHDHVHLISEEVAAQKDVLAPGGAHTPQAWRREGRQRSHPKMGRFGHNHFRDRGPRTLSLRRCAAASRRRVGCMNPRRSHRRLVSQGTSVMAQVTIGTRR